MARIVEHLTINRTGSLSVMRFDLDEYLVEEQNHTNCACPSQDACTENILDRIGAVKVAKLLGDTWVTRESESEQFGPGEMPEAAKVNHALAWRVRF